MYSSLPANQMGWEGMLSAASCDVRRLDYVDRFSSIPVTIRETVSAHSYWVCLYAVLIHRHLNGNPALIGPICLNAITHDLIECITGDIVRTFKYSSPEFKMAVDLAEGNMLTKLPQPIQELFHLWEELAGVDKPYVSAVVKTADFVSLHQYMVREVSRGNLEIRPFFERMCKDLRTEAEKLSGHSDPRVASMAGLFSKMAETTTPGHRTA